MKSSNFIKDINGITISPKKSFCIVKIWMKSLNFQIYEYKPNNIYQSVRLEYLIETPFCIVNCSEVDKGLGMSVFYGKYLKSNYVL